MSTEKALLMLLMVSLTACGVRAVAYDTVDTTINGCGLVGSLQGDWTAESNEDSSCACRDTCKAKSECWGWNWNSDSTKCYMKKNMNGFKLDSSNVNQRSGMIPIDRTLTSACESAHAALATVTWTNNVHELKTGHTLFSSTACQQIQGTDDWFGPEKTSSAGSGTWKTDMEQILGMFASNDGDNWHTNQWNNKEFKFDYCPVLKTTGTAQSTSLLVVGGQENEACAMAATVYMSVCPEKHNDPANCDTCKNGLHGNFAMSSVVLSQGKKCSAWFASADVALRSIVGFKRNLIFGQRAQSCAT